MEIFVLLLFAVLLVVCIALDLSILYALIAGFILFFLYSLKKGNSVKATLLMAFDGVKTAKNVIITMLLIGILTGLWRAAGTIPSIVFYAVNLITPSVFILLTFLLNCLVSFLTGTAFGTAATMGTVCMTIGLALEMSPFLMGGAILSGVFFGDRCSPVSTSALLTAELTGTDIYDNIKLMVKTSLVPFFLTCLIYLLAGFALPHGSGEMIDVRGLFSAEFRVGLLPLIPAAVILILAAFRVSVRKSMLTSIAAAFLLCLFFQKLSLLNTLKIMLTGYQAADPTLAGMINGGGLTSMIKVSFIIAISSSYSGIFEKTGLLEPVKAGVARLSDKVCPFAVILLTSIVTAAISCNQTLGTMLTEQICCDTQPDKQARAIDLENSTIVVAPLIPWSIAGSVPLATVGAPTSGTLMACYLYLLPLWYLLVSMRRKKNGI